MTCQSAWFTSALHVKASPLNADSAGDLLRHARDPRLPALTRLMFWSGLSRGTIANDSGSGLA
jgi:hypothetical protein